MKKFAFTLAEVLITLGIIGVVAAITIPNLIANYQKQVYITQLKKVYSEIAQAIEKTKYDTGCNDNECMGFSGSVNDEKWRDWATNWAKKYFKVTDFCYGTNKCAYPVKYVNNKFTMDDKYAATSFPANSFAFITADGAIIKLTPAAPTSVQQISFDVNGFKGPNQFGRDFHLLRLLPDTTLVPNYGLKYCIFATNKNGTCRDDLYWKTNPNLCNPDNPSSPGASYGCTARIIESGWKMDF